MPFIVRLQVLLRWLGVFAFRTLSAPIGKAKPEKTPLFIRKAQDDMVEKLDLNILRGMQNCEKPFKQEGVSIAGIQKAYRAVKKSISKSN